MVIEKLQIVSFAPIGREKIVRGEGLPRKIDKFVETRGVSTTPMLPSRESYGLVFAIAGRPPQVLQSGRVDATCPLEGPLPST